MNHLELSKANEIASLAHANFETIPEGGSLSDAVESLFAPRRAEELALDAALEELSHDEALDLVALMYVGRGDLIEDQDDSSQVLEAFESHRRHFSPEETSTLAHICSEKNLVLARYLRHGLDLIARARS